MKDSKIQKLREKINDIDDKILDLLSSRSNVVSDIGKQKTDINPPDGMEWKKWD